ncbi:MAG: hypothetical protein M5R36_10240 [Deltaproteobacteria bacterium]|nr:hypothetical protein [Deltaproteobacteria bacterium]
MFEVRPAHRVHVGEFRHARAVAPEIRREKAGQRRQNPAPGEEGDDRREHQRSTGSQRRRNRRHERRREHHGDQNHRKHERRRAHQPCPKTIRGSPQ